MSSTEDLMLKDCETNHSSIVHQLKWASYVTLSGQGFWKLGDLPRWLSYIFDLKLLSVFSEVHASLRVQPEIDEGPFNALSLVLLLLQDEHVVVGKLRICEVDAQLLKAVELRWKKNRCSDTSE